MLHLACGRIQFADRGKSSIIPSTTMPSSPMTKPKQKPKPEPRPRSIANDMIDAIESGTRKWTRQKKSEERHPGNVRYRRMRMTYEPRTTQKKAVWEHMEQAYMRASGGGRLPASARQIYYQIRPKVMEATDDRELSYKYFSQTLLPDYIEEHGVAWHVVYDARGHFEEPHTNRRIGCGTLEVGNYLHAVKAPKIRNAGFEDAGVEVIGPQGGYVAVLFCEKEGFSPLWKAVNLANRYDLMIVSTKGVSVTAARLLIERVCCGGRPLFVLHDFDVAGFLILGTLQRSTRRYRFSGAFEVHDLGLRLEDVDGLGSEPAAATKTDSDTVAAQLAKDGATPEEIAILLDERVELNALASDDLVEMIERKLKAYGLKKAMPNDKTLAETYRAYHRGQELRERFEEMAKEYDAKAKEAGEAEVPADLREKAIAVLDEHDDLRWDDAVQMVLDPTLLDRLREEKGKAREKSGDFTGDAEDSDLDDEEDSDFEDATNRRTNPI
jgi:hypothetical protein